MTNIDAPNGGDSHKSFDIYVGPGESLLDRVLQLNQVHDLGRREAARHALARPSARGMPADLRAALTAIAEESP